MLQVNGVTRAIQAAQLQEQERIARLANTAHNIRFYINDAEIENVTKYTVSWMNNQCWAMARHSLQAKREEPRKRLREGHFSLSANILFDFMCYFMFRFKIYVFQ
jgi:hypothetical protein